MVLCYGSPSKLIQEGNIIILHYMWKQAQREQALPQCAQPTRGKQSVPESVFLTGVFKHNSVLSIQSNAFALKQSFVWAQSYSKEKGINELLCWSVIFPKRGRSPANLIPPSGARKGVLAIVSLLIAKEETSSQQRL